MRASKYLRSNVLEEILASPDGPRLSRYGDVREDPKRGVEVNEHRLGGQIPIFLSNHNTMHI